jgi:hypothetical protein
MVIRLSSGSKNTRGLKGNSNAKLAATPHWRSTVLVKQATRWFHRKLGELEDQFTRNFRSTYTRSTSIEEVKSCIQKSGKMLRSYIQRWSIIKNSAENVSDERAIDVFAFGLRCSDIVEELGRIRPRTVSELRWRIGEMHYSPNKSWKRNKM